MPEEKDIQKANPTNARDVVNHMLKCGECQRHWMTGIHCKEFESVFLTPDWEGVRVITNNENLSFLPVRWDNDYD